MAEETTATTTTTTETAQPAADATPASTAEQVTVATTEKAPTEKVDPQAAAEAAEEAIYDAGMKELLAPEKGEATETLVKPVETKAVETKPATTETTTTGPVLTESEEAALKRAGYEAEEYAGWDRAKIEGRVAKLRAAFAEHEKVVAKPAETKPEAKKPEAKPTPFGEKLTKVTEALVKEYEAPIGALGELFQDMDASVTAAREQAAMVPVLTELVGELVLQTALNGLTGDYPSLTKPDARQKVMERFWTEWNTGTYTKPGVSMLDQMRTALTNAAKVTFLNTNEQTAAASLVQANKARVASQPKPGSPNARPQPRSAEDIYNVAFEETIGKELAAR